MTPPRADAPARIVAIVAAAESIEPALPLLGYVREGSHIRLGAEGRLVLGYLDTCIEETVTGGELIAGVEQSETRDGAIVERRRVECDAAGLRFDGSSSTESGAIVMRDVPETEAGTRAEITIFGTMPVIRFAAAARSFTWRRLDRAGSPATVELTSSNVDFAALDIALERGGLYALEAVPGRRLIVRVHRAARAGAVPLLSRLIDMER